MSKPGFRPIFPCLCGLLIAAPAAAQQRPASPTPAHPDRLVPPSAADAAREAAPFGRLPIAARENMAFGVGMFSVTGHFVRERGRSGREPMIDTAGRQNRVAAVGLSLRF